MAKSKQAEPIAQGEGAPGYLIVGLQPSDSMMIEFDGKRYDLARLSADDAAYLLGFPDQVPYLHVTIPVTP